MWQFCYSAHLTHNSIALGAIYTLSAGLILCCLVRLWSLFPPPPANTSAEDGVELFACSWRFIIAISSFELIVRDVKVSWSGKSNTCEESCLVVGVFFSWLNFCENVVSLGKVFFKQNTSSKQLLCTGRDRTSFGKPW